MRGIGIGIGKKRGYIEERKELEKMGEVLSGVDVEMEEVKVSERGVKWKVRRGEVGKKRVEVVKRRWGGERWSIKVEGSEDVFVDSVDSIKRGNRYEGEEYYEEGIRVIERGKSKELGEWIREKIKEGKRVVEILGFIKEGMEERGMSGRVEIKGRGLGGERSKKEERRIGGVIGKRRVGGEVDYTLLNLKTKYGMSGIKVWVMKRKK